MSRSTSTSDRTSIAVLVRIRQALRLSAMACWTVLLVGLRLLVMPLAPILPRVERRLRQYCIMTWARGTLFLVGAKVSIQGRPPKAPYLQVSNHLSYLDIFALQSVLGPIFVSKAEVASWPLFGWIARWMQTVFLNRERMRDVARVTKIVEDILKTGYGIHVFPEGGITQDASVRPFKPGLLEVAIRAGIPVHYVAVSYTAPPDGPPPSDWLVWRSGMSFLTHLKRLAAGSGFEIRLTFGDRPLSAPDRKQLAQDLTAAVQTAYPGVD